MAEGDVKARAKWAGRIALAAMVLVVSAPAGARAEGAAARAAGPAAWVGDLSPIAPGDWSYDRAAHLLERAGFGGTPEEIERLAAMTPEAAVGRLVDYTAVASDRTKPFDHSGIHD